MVNAVMLDAGPLGRIAHPRPNAHISSWLLHLLDSGVLVFVPEIAHYEVRRNLLLEGLLESITRLDEIKIALNYVPLNTETLLIAAKFWAQARKRGVPTADPKELDGDVILTAQALQTKSVVATENVGHLSLFVEAKDWKEIA